MAETTDRKPVKPEKTEKNGIHKDVFIQILYHYAGMVNKCDRKPIAALYRFPINRNRNHTLLIVKGLETVF